MIEGIAAVFVAVLVDLAFGDPKNRYHPTVWMGRVIAWMAPMARHADGKTERLRGTAVVLAITGMVLAASVVISLALYTMQDHLMSVITSIIILGMLLSTTIAIKGMQTHAQNVATMLVAERLSTARESLAMIVKRDTSGLQRPHIVSGVLESVSENTVDGITGPLFYFGLAGLPGAFVYRLINTMDSMIGYRTYIFGNIGWFAARCDTVLNYIPSRLTALMMIMSAALLGHDWRSAYRVMRLEAASIDSKNAGYPMAALAGALNIRLEKPNHYTLGSGDEPTCDHISNAVSIMKLTTILFSIMISIPVILLLSGMGWWIHA